MKRVFFPLFLFIVAYGAFAYIPGLDQFVPEGRLRRFVQLPTMAVSRMELFTMDVKYLILGLGLVLFLLVGLYMAMAK